MKTREDRKNAAILSGLLFIFFVIPLLVQLVIYLYRQIF